MGVFLFPVVILLNKTTYQMKRKIRIALTMMVLLLGVTAAAQERKMNTLFSSRLRSSGGYGALTNSFTKIRGDFANLSGFYGGWYINHRFLLGIGASASTNNLRVPAQFSTDPARNRTYQYGQFGLKTEYVLGSDKAFHIVLQALGGAGFTLQYERNNWHTDPQYNDVTDENWFVVAEPGVQLELNLFKWMRFSPGVSYRATFGSNAAGLKDKDLSAVAYSVSLKFGKF